MKNLLRNIGKKSKKALSVQLNTKKKNKVLKDYLYLIIKNKKLILKENLKDIKDAHKKKLKDNLIKRLVLDEKKNFLYRKFYKKNNKIKRSDKYCFRKMETA